MPRSFVRLALGLVLLILCQAIGVVAGVAATAADLLPDDPVAGVVRFEGADGTVITTGTGRYLDTIEVRRAPAEDLLVINELSMQDYVLGIAEMPASWPIEALKAQAVAARTYAWFELAQGRWRNRGYGYDICATTSCQVFRGLEVVEGSPEGANWRRAVDETDGEVLTFDGRPILARYFSTSGGLRWANDVIFPSSGSYPYLVGGPDPDDEASPLHTWQVRFTAEQFQELLSRGQTLAPATPYARVQSIASTTPGLTRALRVTGQDGTVAEVGAVAFRQFVSDVAPLLWPDEQPGPRRDGGRLPTAMPSSRFTVDVLAGEDVVIEGRGWGHGVGLGQWGAFGKAERGLGYEEILAAYYNGLVPTRPAGLPGRLSVGLDASLLPVSVNLDGPARLVVAGELVSERALGTWEVGRASDQRLEVVPPVGFGEPVEVADTTTSRSRPSPVEIVTIGTEVNQPVELQMDVLDPETDLVLTSFDLGVREAGHHELRWSLDDADGARLPSGTYHVEMVGRGHTGEPVGTPVSVEVRAFDHGGGDEVLPPTMRSPVPAAGGLPPAAVPFAVAVAVGLVLGIGSGIVVTRPGRRFA